MRTWNYTALRVTKSCFNALFFFFKMAEKNPQKKTQKTKQNKKQKQTTKNPKLFHLYCSIMVILDCKRAIQGYQVFFLHPRTICCPRPISRRQEFGYWGTVFFPWSRKMPSYERNCKHFFFKDTESLSNIVSKYRPSDSTDEDFLRILGIFSLYISLSSTGPSFE